MPPFFGLALASAEPFPQHLAAVVDDHLMKISHIVRAEEWLSSTPKHVLLYRYFNWDMPPIFHTPALRNPDKSKLSKRHGHTNVTFFKDEGYLPEAILNYLALLGWSHPEEKEIFSLDEFISLFDLKDIRPVAPIFDLTKLTWMNQQYIMTKSAEELKVLINKFYVNENLPDELLTKLIPLVSTRMTTLKDFMKLTSVFFSPPVITIRNDNEKLIIENLQKLLEKITDWNTDNILTVLKSIMQASSVKMPVLYYIFTGQEKGLPLPESLKILGKEETIKRLNKLLQ